MARNKNKILSLSVFEQLIKLHREMKKICVEAGIQEIKYNFAIKHLEKRTPAFQETLLTWLQHFKQHEYKVIENLLDEMPSHFWENAKLMNHNDMHEVVLLHKRQAALRNAWLNRPRPPKKNINEKTKNILHKDS